MHPIWAITTTATTAPIRVVVDNGPSAPWYEDPTFLGLFIPLAVAVIAAWAAHRQNLHKQADARRDRLTSEYGHALADVLAWAELPYRIARRTSDTPEALAQLASRFHGLQERIEHHLRWLQLDSAAVGTAYKQLVDTVKRKAEADIAKAWIRPPVTTAAGMVLGGEIASVDVTAECEAYTAAVEAHLDDLNPRLLRRRNG